MCNFGEKKEKQHSAITKWRRFELTENTVTTNTVSDLNQPGRVLATCLLASRSQKGKSDAHTAGENCCCEKDNHPITSILLWGCGVAKNMGECLMGRLNGLNLSPTNFKSNHKTICEKKSGVEIVERA